MPRRAVFFLPHPDDEFGVFGEFERLRKCDVELHACFLTRSKSPNVQQRRMKESIRVLQYFGFETRNIHWIGLQLNVIDGSLHRFSAPLLTTCDQLLADFGRDCEIQLYVPAFEGGHQDHDAAHVIGTLAALRAKQPLECFQFPLYNGAGLRHGLFRVLTPLRANGNCIIRRCSRARRAVHLAWCLTYTSQWRSWIGLWPAALIRWMSMPHSLVQEVEPRRVHERPHDGPLLYEERGFSSWTEVSAALNEIIATRVPAATTASDVPQ